MENLDNQIFRNIKPVFFHHIMKTAGRALVASVFDVCSKLLKSNFSGIKLYNLAGFKPVVIGPWKCGGPHDNSPIWNTHFPAWKGYFANRYRITIFRHPLERLISLFRMYEIEHPEHPWWYIFSDNLEPEPIDFIDKTPDSIICNDVYMFSKSINPVEAFREISKLDLVIWQDRFQEGLDALSILMNLPKMNNYLFGESYNGRLTRENLLNNSSFIKKAIERLKPSFKLMRLLQRPDLTGLLSPEHVNNSNYIQNREIISVEQYIKQIELQKEKFPIPSPQIVKPVSKPVPNAEKILEIPNPKIQGRVPSKKRKRCAPLRPI